MNIHIGKSPLEVHTIDNTNISNCSLQTFFSKVKFEDERGEPHIPVLIFDQFEETINNEDNWQKTVDFLKTDLYDLLDNSNVISGEILPYTNYRIIISMREDYLYCLEDIIDRFSLWELRYNRFRIKALNDLKATEVIRKTSGINGLEEGKEKLIVDTIIRIVKLNSGTRFTEINTALLSLVCSLLYENSENGCVRYKDLRNINSYLRSYYDDICDIIGSEATHYLESHLLTKDGRRSYIDESEAIYSGKISQKALDFLVKKRLVRRIKTDNSSNKYEYIHDLFAKMVFKRLQEDKSKWFYPELRTISKRVGRSTFVRKFFFTSLSVISICCGQLALHFYIVHDTWRFWDFTICTSNVLYYMLFVFSVYALSIVTKRLHDVNKSGWLCLIIPLSAFLISIPHIYPSSFEKSPLLVAPVLIGYLLIGYFLFLCLKKSVSPTKPRNYSREYEQVFNMESIGNIELVKWLTIELLWWGICCCMTDMLISANYDLMTDYTGTNTWKLFKEQKFIILEKFGLNKSVPAAISLSPIIICASPALRARVKSLGYPVWISFIPYLNFILLLIGSMPNNVLMRLGLFRVNKNDQQQETDNIFAEINEDFSIINDYDVVYKQQVRHNLSLAKIILLSIVPLYGLINGFNKKEPSGVRVTSLFIGLVNCWIINLLLSFMNCINDFLGYLLIVIDLIALLVFVIGLLCEGRNQRRMIMDIMKEHPEYSINQIAHELVAKPSGLEKEIKLMKKKGMIMRVEENRQLVWKVNDTYKKK